MVACLEGPTHLDNQNEGEQKILGEHAERVQQGNEQNTNMVYVCFAGEERNQKGTAYSGFSNYCTFKCALF